VTDPVILMLSDPVETLRDSRTHTLIFARASGEGEASVTIIDMEAVSYNQPCNPHELCDNDVLTPGKAIERP